MIPVFGKYILPTPKKLGKLEHDFLYKGNMKKTYHIDTFLDYMRPWPV